MMYEGVGVKALLVKHLISTKEIEDFDEFNDAARKRFFINERGDFTKRGIILAKVVQSDPSLLLPD